MKSPKDQVREAGSSVGSEQVRDYRGKKGLFRNSEVIQG